MYGYIYFFCLSCFVSLDCTSVSAVFIVFFFFSSRRRHTRFSRDWSSDVCSSDLGALFCVCRPIMDGACILCVPKTRFGNIGGEVHRVRAAPRRRQSARSPDEWERPCPVIDASSTML